MENEDGLLDVSDLSIAELAALMADSECASLARVLDNIEQDDGAISAFSSFVS